MRINVFERTSTINNFKKYIAKIGRNLNIYRFLFRRFITRLNEQMFMIVVLSQLRNIYVLLIS